MKSYWVLIVQLLPWVLATVAAVASWAAAGRRPGSWGLTGLGVLTGAALWACGIVFVAPTVGIGGVLLFGVALGLALRRAGRLKGGLVLLVLALAAAAVLYSFPQTASTEDLETAATRTEEQLESTIDDAGVRFSVVRISPEDSAQGLERLSRELDEDVDFALSLLPPCDPSSEYGPSWWHVATTAEAPLWTLPEGRPFFLAQPRPHVLVAMVSADNDLSSDSTTQAAFADAVAQASGAKFRVAALVGDSDASLAETTDRLKALQFDLVVRSLPTPTSRVDREDDWSIVILSDEPARSRVVLEADLFELAVEEVGAPDEKSAEAIFGWRWKSRLVGWKPLAAAALGLLLASIAALFPLVFGTTAMVGDSSPALAAAEA